MIVMAMYAYKDKDRTTRVLAKDTTERDKGIRYYCPNLKCRAKMFIRSCDGESKSFLLLQEIQDILNIAHMVLRIHIIRKKQKKKDLIRMTQ